MTEFVLPYLLNFNPQSLKSARISSSTAKEIIMYIPAILSQEAGLIRGLDIDNQTVPFDLGPWKREIPYLDELLPDFVESDAYYKELVLSRGFLGRLLGDPEEYIKVSRSRTPAELRRLFILVMIWGYGRVGVGPWRTRIMTESDGFDQTLMEVWEDCWDGLFLRAYETLLHRVDRIGPAFASKFLYFLCYLLEAPVKPLIFDSMVVKALRNFDWPADRVDYLASGKVPRRSIGAYGQYLVLMHNWASRLRCRPDQLEYYLWARGSGRNP